MQVIHSYDFISMPRYIYFLEISLLHFNDKFTPMYINVRIVVRDKFQLAKFFAIKNW